MPTHEEAKLTRPIIGIENRTPQEVFDIMCDRIRSALTSASAAGEAHRRWDIEEDGRDLLICRGEHDKSEKCTYVRYSPVQPEESAVGEADTKRETYYSKGKDAEYFERLPNKEFAWALTCASQDLNDSDENVSTWMPVSAMLSSAADRISAALVQPGYEWPVGTHVSVEHDGFVGTVIGHYQRTDGKRGVVVQQDGTKVVHVYGEKWLSK